MYTNRWYDKEPLLAKAVEMLIQDVRGHRKALLLEVEEWIGEHHPKAEEKQARDLMNLKFIHQRQTMDPLDWLVVERIKYLDIPQQQSVAQWIIRAINEYQAKQAVY